MPDDGNGSNDNKPGPPPTSSALRVRPSAEEIGDTLLPAARSEPGDRGVSAAEAAPTLLPAAPAIATDPTVAAPQPTASGPTLAVGTHGSGAATHPQAVTSSGAALVMLDTERYRLGELLGKGGMGEVLLAFDEQLGREVALKRIRGEDPSGELLARFLREARVQGRLQHPGVVPVHDLAFDRERRPYFVMKRLSGTTMADLLRESAGDEKVRQRLLRAFVDVCLAIEFAHQKGIVHRDLKPANIMLGDFGEVYVLDWGIARALSEPDDAGASQPSAVNTDRDLQLDSGETRVGAVLGTPAYMSPEQLAGERAGSAADVYALGCSLFEIAAGKMLHEGRRSFSSIAKPPHAGPSRIRPDSPPELDAICEQATQVDPADRFPSARALGDAVQAFLDGDRDLALRKELAVTHIRAARDAMAAGADEENRRTAMREAGRALALDPTATEAADLVTRLVLEPPVKIPDEVEARIAEMDLATAKQQGKLAAASVIGYLGFVPLLLWTGMRDMTYLAAFVALAIACGIQVWAMTQGDAITRRGIYTSVVINALIITVVCRMVGPFVIAPTLVMTTLMAYAAHPRFGSMKIISVMLAGGVVVPWILEIAGILSPTYRFTEGGELVLASGVLTFSSAPVQLAFAGLLLALVVVVAVLTRGMARAQRTAARAVELQAWHLRQLVPTRTP